MLLTCVLLEATSALLISLLDIPAPSLYFHDNPTLPERWDPERGWALRPGVYDDGKVRINRMGFRSSTDLDLAAQRSKKRVLLLGDSMAFGAGVEQEAIASEVMNRESSRLEIVNTGVIGYDTGQEYLVQRHLSPLINPDAAVLFFTEENDPWWNVRTDDFSPDFTIQGDDLIYHPPRRHLSLPPLQQTNFARLVSELFRGGDFIYLKDRLSYEIFGEYSYVWAVTKRLIGEMRSVADRHQYPLIIVDIPSQGQIRHTVMSRSRQRLMARLSAEWGIRYIDLLDYYPEDPSGLFMPGDSHWNVEGHRFIARLLTRILEEQ